MKRKLKLAFFVSLLALLIGIAVSGQDNPRILYEAKYNFRDCPIEIISRDVGDKAFNDRRVAVGPDWLENLTLTVKNVSAKNINEISIMVVIPKQGSMEYASAFYYPFPRGDAQYDEKGKLTYGPIVTRMLMPGETIKLKAWEHQLKILDNLKELGVTDISGVTIGIRSVSFDDGTRWLPYGPQ